jgi:heat shock protein HslJ
MVALAILAAAACDDTPSAPSDAVGQTWRLVSLQRDGSDLVFTPDGDTFTLRLEDDGRVAVKADCNARGGSYTMSGAEVEFSAIACTTVACQNAAPFDSDYVLALEGPKTVTVNESELLLRGSGVTLRLRR